MLGIICGLATEAVLARRIKYNEGKVLVACAGADPQRARWLARQLVKDGATRLLSFGIAGALEPGLPVGSLIIASEVVSADGRLACDKNFTDRLAQNLPTAHCGPVWGAEAVIPTAKAKRQLYERSRCLIVDMESQCVAQIAKEAALPFAVLRAVSDAAETHVPSLVGDVIGADGKVMPGRLLRNILRHPIIFTRELPEMMRLGRGTGKALNTLKTTTGILT